jgi:hypothetical protein
VAVEHYPKVVLPVQLVLLARAQGLVHDNLEAVVVVRLGGRARARQGCCVQQRHARRCSDGGLFVGRRRRVAQHLVGAAHVQLRAVKGRVRRLQRARAEAQEA